MSIRTPGLGLAVALPCILVGVVVAQEKLTCTKPTVAECIDERWEGAEEWDGVNPQDTVHWSDKIAALDWNLDSNEGCARVQADAEAIFSTVKFWTGIPKGNYNGMLVPGVGESDAIVLSAWYMLEEEGWYFEERLGLAFWFSSNGDGTASVTVCSPDGEWEKVCEGGDG